MFEKLKRLVSDQVNNLERKAGLPPDLAAVPDVAGRDLATIDLGVLTAYVGREVVAVEPMGMSGPEATTMLGRKTQERMRAASGGADPAAGELVAGQAAAREARLRAEGLTEDQIRQVREHIAHEVAAHTADGWTVRFTDDHRASVQVFAAGSEEAEEYEQLRARWARENGTDGHRPEKTPALMATVQRVKGAPYESYCLKGRLAAKGARHVAVAASVRVGTMNLAALAAVALRSVEGRAEPGA